MATTTAAVTLTSDLLSDNISVSASSTLMKAGTTADGLDQMEYGYLDLPTGDEYDLIATTPTATKASKLYLKKSLNRRNLLCSSHSKRTSYR